VTPKLSVITPSLNQGEYIERTITSVLEQGYPNLEYVLVDGGSTDQTAEIVKRYEEHLTWWVSEPDQGQTDAINKGIRRTTGEIVAYLNSDDYYLPGAFERAIDAFERQPTAKYVAGAVLDLDKEGHLTKMGAWRPEPPERYERWPRGRHWWVLAPYYQPQSSVFWRRELFERHGLFSRELNYAFDSEFMCRLAFGSEELALIPGEALSVRVAHEDQKSADAPRLAREIALFPRIYRDRLTPGERVRLRFTSALRTVGIYRAADEIRAAGVRLWVLNRVIGPVVRAVGDLLDWVPAAIRPPIRGRDRRGW
jgi:glycosyltransferase involved in cell wall biosynthesis